jgi:hypothetical protein
VRTGGPDLGVLARPGITPATFTDAFTCEDGAAFVVAHAIAVGMHNRSLGESAPAGAGGGRGAAGGERRQGRIDRDDDTAAADKRHPRLT